MNDFLEISKYVIPSLVVFTTAYLMVKEFFKREEKKLKLEVFLKNQKETTPIRLQAYERLIIFLERIHPESLVIRENKNGLSNAQLQQKLMSAIRDEFEHNIAQQLYVSAKSWMLVKNAKESMIQLINTQAAQLVPNESSLVLCKAIIESHMQQQKPAIEIAISGLKEEVQMIWN